MHILKHSLILVFAVVLTGLSRAQDVPPAYMGYTLVPSKESIRTHVDLKSSGYGVNVLLHKNGTPVLDQSNVKFVWEVGDPSILKLDLWTAGTSCTHGIKAPCPNNTADLKALKTGSTQIYVVAYVDGIKVTAKTIKVYVSDDWIVDLSANPKVIYANDKYLFTARLLLDDSSLEKRTKREIDADEVMFKWDEVPNDGERAILNIYQDADNLCSETNNNPNCSDSRNFIVQGTRPGKTKLRVEAINYDYTVLDSATFSIEVINQAEQPLIYEDKLDTLEPMVIDDQVPEFLPDPYDPVNNEVGNLKEELKKQQQQLEEQSKRIAEQAERLNKTETLLQKIVNRFRKLFGGF